MFTPSARLLLALALAVAGFVFVVAPLVILGGCSGCSPSSMPAPGPRAPAPSSSTSRPPTCAGYCDHLRDLGCPGSAASPAGTSCEDRCTAAQSAVAPLDLGCRASASSCSAVDACEAPR